MQRKARDEVIKVEKKSALVAAVLLGEKVADEVERVADLVKTNANDRQLRELLISVVRLDHPTTTDAPKRELEEKTDEIQEKLERFLNAKDSTTGNSAYSWTLVDHQAKLRGMSRKEDVDKKKLNKHSFAFRDWFKGAKKLKGKAPYVSEPFLGQGGSTSDTNFPMFAISMAIVRGDAGEGELIGVLEASIKLEDLVYEVKKIKVSSSSERADTTSSESADTTGERTFAIVNHKKQVVAHSECGRYLTKIRARAEEDNKGEYLPTYSKPKLPENEFYYSENWYDEWGRNKKKRMVAAFCRFAVKNTEGTWHSIVLRSYDDVIAPLEGGLRQITDTVMGASMILALLCGVSYLREKS